MIEESVQSPPTTDVRQWEEFPTGPRDAEDRLHVTLDRKGTLLLGRTVFERMRKPEAVVLLFDRLNGLIGVRPAPMHQPNAYPVIAKSQVTYRVVRASRFCRHYGIRVPSTIAFDKPMIEQDRTLVLNLRATRNVSR
jgi:hypothetical protein